MFDYSPLWETMQRRGVSQYQLLKSGVDNKTLDALKKGRNITMVTLEKLCRIIGCTPNDVIRFSDEPRRRSYLLTSKGGQANACPPFRVSARVFPAGRTCFLLRPALDGGAFFR